MELRHLRYFVAVVQSKGFRQASRQLHIAQAAISQTLSNLEHEIGVELLRRAGRTVELTPEGEIFYPETLRTLEQADRAVETVRGAARGEVGSITIGFCGAATYAFLPDLIRNFRVRHPGVRLILRDLSTVQLETALAQGTVDVVFTTPLSTELAVRFHERLVNREPLLAALPSSRRMMGKRIQVASLAGEPFVLFHRANSPGPVRQHNSSLPRMRILAQGG